MSCSMSACGNLIMLHIFLERIWKSSQSRVVCNHMCFSMLWKINCFFHWKKTRTCLKCQFRNRFIFLDSFCPTCLINRHRGASHSPHSQQDCSALPLVAMARGSYRGVQCLAHISIPCPPAITPPLKAWVTDPARLLTALQQGITWRKLLAVHRPKILAISNVLAKIHPQ